MAYFGNEPAKVAVKVGSGVITATELADDSITTADIIADAITPTELDEDGTGFQVGTLGIGAAVSGGHALLVSGTASISGHISATTGTFSGNLDTGDNAKLRLGNGSDFKFYHDGSHSRIENDTGDITVDNTSHGGDISFYVQDSGGSSFTPLTLASTGTATFAGGIDMAGDNKRLRLGASQDLQIWHSGSDSLIADSGTGNLLIGGSSEVAIMDNSFSEYMVRATHNSWVKLYYDNAEKLSTTSTGIEVAGTSSTFAGDIYSTGQNIRLTRQSTSQVSRLWMTTSAGEDSGAWVLGMNLTGANTTNPDFRIQRWTGSDTTAMTIAHDLSTTFAGDVYSSTGFRTAGYIKMNNAQALQAEDSGGTQRELLKLSSGNVLQIAPANHAVTFGTGTATFAGEVSVAKDVTVKGTAWNDMFYLGDGTSSKQTVSFTSGSAAFGISTGNSSSKGVISAYHDGSIVYWGADFTTNQFAGDVNISASEGTLKIANTGGTATTWRMTAWDAGKFYISDDNGSTKILTITASDNSATFAGNVEVANGKYTITREDRLYDGTTFRGRLKGTSTGISLQANEVAGDDVEIFANDAVYLKTGSGTVLTCDGLNATFAGKVEVGSTTGMARIQVDNDADNPPYQFVNDSNSGFFRAADGQPGIAGYGVEIARFIPANNDSTYAEMALRSLRDDGQGCKITAYTTTDSNDWADIRFGRAGSSETNMMFRVHDTGNGIKTTTFQYHGGVYNPSDSTNWSTSSDVRIKKDINDLTGAIDVLKKIRPVSYKLKKAWTDEKGHEYGRVKNGFIADEYKDVFPNAVVADRHPVKVGSETYDDFLSLDTEDLVPYLVKAVQELSAKVTALENE